MQCQWFVMCNRPAVGTVWHPVLGEVPVCAGCRDLASNIGPDRPLYRSDVPPDPHPDDDDPFDHEFGCTCIFCTPGA